MLDVRERVTLSAYERSVLPEVLRGLAVSSRHLFGSRRTRSLRTIRYPEERRVFPPRHRGQHRLLPREDGSPRCIA